MSAYTNKFKKRVAELIGDVGFIGPYIYFRPVGNVLSGFCVEETPRGIYISIFFFPLFDMYEELNLNLSERIPYPDGYIDYDVCDKDNVADEFVNRVRPYLDKARYGMEVENVARYISDHKDILRNEWIKKDYIILLIFLGRSSEARPMIDELLEQRFSGERARIGKVLSEVQSVLNSPESARSVLLRWSDSVKEKLGVL